jgi:SNF2 family DNA or RNA helicase
MILDQKITKLKWYTKHFSTWNSLTNTFLKVVVSSLLAVLDGVQRLAECKSLCYVRLDGSVAADDRQRMVDRFNNPSDNAVLFLLSCRAGGVGLNLYGLLDI